MPSRSFGESTSTTATTASFRTTCRTIGRRRLCHETGQESYNVIEHNLVIRTGGAAKSDDEHRPIGQRLVHFARPNNYVRDNVATARVAMSTATASTSTPATSATCTFRLPGSRPVRQRPAEDGEHERHARSSSSRKTKCTEPLPRLVAMVDRLRRRHSLRRRLAKCSQRLPSLRAPTSPACSPTRRSE